MDQLSLNVESRKEMGKGSCRRIRRAGKLPGVLYGLGAHRPITVEPRFIQKTLLEEGGRNKVLNLIGTGLEGKHALIKDYQVDPVSRVLLHVDLLEIDVTKKVEVIIPVNLVGKSIGVAEGGVLNIIARSVELRCLPTAIPKHIDVDVSELAIGMSLHLDDLKLPEGIEKADASSNPTLVTVVPPTKEEEAAPSLTPAAAPEVITEKKDASADGAAPAAEAKKDDKKK